MKKTRTLSVLAGLLIAAGLPPWGWWPLTIAGLALWFQLLDRMTPHGRFGRSLLVGAAWIFPSTVWMADLTPIGWPVAAAAFSVMIAMVGWITPSDRGYRGAVFCAAVVLAELVRWNWPFGGVPISTLAMAGVATPLAASVRLFGSPILVALMALAGVILAGLVTRRRASLAAIAVLVVVPVAGLAPWATTNEGDSIRVAVVQGGGPQNTRADVCQNRGVFERHMAAGALIAQTAGEEPVDLVLWPEDVVHPVVGTTTSSPCPEPLLGRSEAASRVSQLADDLNAVLVTGWFEPSADRTANRNYSIVSDSSGATRDSYDKVQLVPFGEYVPLRGFVERFSGELPGRDVRAGTDPAVVDSELGPLGVAISWEVFFDHRARDAIGNGGTVLLNPTNGSSYWLTIVQSQQVASSRLRALETDRWVLQAAPTGFSAIVNPSGEVIARSGVSEQRVLFETIELREGRTLAVVVGAWPVLVGSLMILVFAHIDSLSKAVARRARARKQARRRKRAQRP